MNSVVVRPSISDVIARALQTFSAKFIADKANASPRTVEGWKQGRSIPHGEHVIAMLSDDLLCARLLELAGQGELAKHQETIAALKAVIASEGK